VTPHDVEVTETPDTWSSVFSDSEDEIESMIQVEDGTALLTKNHKLLVYSFKQKFQGHFI
jgi:hypothetical protein